MRDRERGRARGEKLVKMELRSFFVGYSAPEMRANPAETANVRRGSGFEKVKEMKAGWKAERQIW